MAYEKRDEAYQKWLNDNTAVPMEAMVKPFEALREAFNAGWAARKAAQYQALHTKEHLPCQFSINSLTQTMKHTVTLNGVKT